MSRGFLDNNKDIESEEADARAYRRNFVAKMERKLQLQQTVIDSRYQ